MAANFANVALTDSFDTWRVRTNQIITDINTSTASAIANTVVRRDDAGDGGFSMGALNVSGKINSTLGTGTALELSSTKDIDINFQADSGALVVAGGASIAKDLNIGVDLHVGGNIEAKGNIKLGTSPSSALGGLDDDTLELNADISTDIEPEGSVANTERNIGADGKRWKQGHFWRSVGANSSSHLIIPSGTTSESPTIDTNSSGANRELHLHGAIRYNSTLSRFEDKFFIASIRSCVFILSKAFLRSFKSAINLGSNISFTNSLSSENFFIRSSGNNLCFSAA